MRLAKMLKLMRVTESLGVREQAKLIGVSPATISRIENGLPVDATSVIKLMVWLISTEKAA